MGVRRPRERGGRDPSDFGGQGWHKKGLDIQLVRAAGEHLRIPLIASGGIGSPKDCADAILEGDADAVAIATALHYGIYELEDIRTYCDAHNIKTRRIQPANWP